MKKQLLFAGMVLCMTSCVSYEQFTVTNVVDYSEFSQRGIFVTESNSVNFDYQPLGSVVSVTYGNSSDNIIYKTSHVDVSKAFEEIASKINAIGGNGVINLNIRFSATNSRSMMTVSGMAIRTENPIVKPSKVQDFVKPKTDIYVDGIHCFIFKRFQSGIAVLTDAKLTINQVKHAISEFGIKRIEYQFYLPNAKQPYIGVTDNGYIIDYSTNEFIPLN